MVSSTGTLVNSDTTSKLTIISPGLVRRDFSISMKWKEFLTLCTDFPMSGLRSPDRCFDSWYVGAPILLTMCRSGTPSLCILGNPYSLSGLEPDGAGSRLVSSVIEHFLSSRVVFRSIAAVGSFFSFLYAGS